MSMTADMFTRLFGATSYDLRHAIPMATELVRGLVGTTGERIGDGEVYQRLKYPEGLGRFALEVITGDQVYSTEFKSRLAHALLRWHGELDPNVEAAPGLEHCVIYRAGDLTRAEAFGFARSMVHVGSDWTPDIGALVEAFTIAARHWTEDELADAMMFAGTVGAQMAPFVERLHEISEYAAEVAASRLMAQPFPFRDIQLGFALSSEDQLALEGRRSYRDVVIASVCTLGCVRDPRELAASVFRRASTSPGTSSRMSEGVVAGAVDLALDAGDWGLLRAGYDVSQSDERAEILRRAVALHGRRGLKLADGEKARRVLAVRDELRREAA